MLARWQWRGVAGPVCCWPWERSLQRWRIQEADARGLGDPCKLDLGAGTGHQGLADVGDGAGDLGRGGAVAQIFDGLEQQRLKLAHAAGFRRRGLCVGGGGHARLSQFP